MNQANYALPVDQSPVSGPRLAAMVPLATTEVMASGAVPNFGHSCGTAADSGAERPVNLRRSARIVGRRAVASTDSWLWEKAAAKDQGRECQHREPFPVTDAQRTVESCLAPVNISR